MAPVRYFRHIPGLYIRVYIGPEFVVQILNVEPEILILKIIYNIYFLLYYKYYIVGN